LRFAGHGALVCNLCDPYHFDSSVKLRRCILHTAFYNLQNI
jgi:hypothetical protein